MNIFLGHFTFTNFFKSVPYGVSKEKAAIYYRKVIGPSINILLLIFIALESNLSV